MPGIVDYLAASERAGMIAHDHAVLADDDPVGISMDLDRTADGRRQHGVFVVVEAHGAGLRHRGGDAVEAVEAPGIGDQAGAFFLEHVPDRALALLGVPVCPGPGDALVGQPAVQILQRLEAEPRREEALAHQPDLVLNLPLLPARRRRAGLRLDEVMAAHLQESTVVATIPADEDRVHRRLHVVVDAARAGAAEEGERPVMRVEHHLLALARVGSHEEHPAVAKPHVRHLHRRGHPVEKNDLVAPVELVSLARREAQRDVGLGSSAAPFPLPCLRVPPHRTVAALIAEVAKLLEYPDQRQPLPLRLGSIRRQKPIQLFTPGAHPRIGLMLALVTELRLTRTQHFAHNLPRDLQLSADRLDRLPMNQRQPTYLCNRLHNQHPKHKCLRSNRRHFDDPTLRGPVWTKITPQTGSSFHEKAQFPRLQR